MRTCMKTIWLVVAVSAVVGLGASAAAAAGPSPAPPLADDERHIVFAHYMVCFGSSVEFYKQEIELAQRHGIDGFVLNAGGWGNLDAGSGELSPEAYIQSAERIYEAARQLNSGFKLMMSPDLTGISNLPVQIGDMVKRFARHPNQFRVAGKSVLSGYAGTPASYAPTIALLKKEGYDVCLARPAQTGIRSGVPRFLS